MASEQFSLCWDNFHKNMSSGMNSLLENEDLVDVTLAVEGKCLKAHKMVLSVCSPYFKELFKSNPCQHPIVFMKDVSYVALSDLLQFMYQGEVQVSQENLTTFIKTAEALQIKGLTGDGNGSADTEPTETTPHEKPVHHIEEYKPVPRPKKQPAPVSTPSPSVKRQRLSVSSSDSQPLPAAAIAKTEPVAAPQASGVGGGGPQVTEPPVQFKMEPYDQSQALIDETGDENFGDDNLDDANVDDTEDYSMMEGGVGEEEPQAGTSTDGAGEGQDHTGKHRKAVHGRYNKLDLEDGFLYFKLKQFKDRIYLRCAVNNDVNCKASYVVTLEDGVPNVNTMKCIVPHNHPPDEMAVQIEKFLYQLKKAVEVMDYYPLKKIYSIVAEGYPELAKFYPYKVVARRMRYWEKLERNKVKYEPNDSE